MPLSEHEQRLLEQIEQGLYAEDPKFASTVRKVRARSGQRRRIVVAIVGVILGLALVLLALVTKIIVIAVVGFVIIVAACAYAVGTSLGTRTPNGPFGIVDSTGAGTKVRRQSGMKERMEDRLRRRFDEQ
ncbi:MAG: DUF3040 domain-containing protein [Actinomycetota bacterium]|nr:DUF3040 domain-containing protein [Actinomycetota bacterium]